MKLLKVVVLVALMFLVGHAQERSDADATYALKGPVRTFRVEVGHICFKDGDYVEERRVAVNGSIVRSQRRLNPPFPNHQNARQV